MSSKVSNHEESDGVHDFFPGSRFLLSRDRFWDHFWTNFDENHEKVIKSFFKCNEFKRKSNMIVHKYSGKPPRPVLFGWVTWRKIRFFEVHGGGFRAPRNKKTTTQKKTMQIEKGECFAPHSRASERAQSFFDVFFLIFA